MRIKHTFDPNLCVHTRILIGLMCIHKTTSGGGFDAHLPLIWLGVLITWTIIHKIAKLKWL